jgi:hypothetical protein
VNAGTNTSSAGGLGRTSYPIERGATSSFLSWDFLSLSSRSPRKRALPTLDELTWCDPSHPNRFKEIGEPPGHDYPGLKREGSYNF